MKYNEHIYLISPMRCWCWCLKIASQLCGLSFHVSIIVYVSKFSIVVMLHQNVRKALLGHEI